MAQIDMVPVKQQDFLDQDDPIRGQKYVCLSFISPEDVIKNKETFFFSRFLSAFSTDLAEFFTNTAERFKDDASMRDMIASLKDRYDYLFNAEALESEYNFFKETNHESIEDAYHKLNNFRTTIRGIKVRGTYDTLPEATRRAEVVKKKDPAFHVYVAEVGCWCPWSPYPEHIENQEYAETQLNTLMKKYKEGQEIKDELYRLRKNDLTNKVKMHPVKESSDEAGSSRVMEGEDPWMANKAGASAASVAETTDDQPAAASGSTQ